MSRIRQLPDSVKQKIAAGEVVEGPFSVLKELVENALDAGATDIAVQVLESGLKRIQVSDNGAGIHRDDLLLAIADHATSKIADVYDIEAITTFGFRGEALSSIAAISKTTILSRRGEEPVGGRLVSQEGEVALHEYAGPRGTTVIVENLFYNTPARKKFLKTHRTELRSLRETLMKIALAHPAVSFTFESDGARQLSFPAAGGLEERIGQVHGREVSAGLCFAEVRDLKVAAHGYLSLPHFSRGSRSLQQLYINGRPVEYRYLGFVLSRAYEAVMPQGQHPAAFIFLEIPPDLIDVNIHPAKREVKVFDQKYIDGIIYSLAMKSLDREQRVRPELFGSGEDTRRGDAAPGGENPERMPAVAGSGMTPPSPPAAAGDAYGPPAGLTTHTLVSETASLYREIHGAADGGILGTVFGTYVVAEREGALYFIDFHAAHERFLFDRIMREDRAVDRQELLFPKVLDLSTHDLRVILENIGEFQEIGFDMDEFSDQALVIRAVPDILAPEAAEELFRELLESVKGEPAPPGDLKKRIAASVACHAARRAGDRLTGAEQARIVDLALGGGMERRCPHGRPFVYRLEKSDLERLFKRS